MIMTREIPIHTDPIPLRVGDIVWGWCSRCMNRQDKLYTGHSLLCLGCHPEKDPRKKIKNEEQTK